MLLVLAFIHCKNLSTLPPQMNLKQQPRAFAWVETGVESWVEARNAPPYLTILSHLGNAVAKGGTQNPDFPWIVVF